MKTPAGGVIVGYDGTLPSARALAWAAAMAEQRELPLTVMHVANYLTATAWAATPRRWPDLLERESREIVEQGARQARMMASIDVSTENTVARVSGALIAASGSARLLVLGAPDRAVPLGTRLVSVALTVSGGAYWPCVVVRGDSSALPGPRRRVIVGTDGSAGAQAALFYAAAIAVESDAPLKVVAAHRSPTTRRSAEDDVAYAVRTSRERFPDLQVSGHLAEGPAGSVLVDASQGAGLLVLGRPKRAGLAGQRLGSVTRGLFNTAPCPVTFVHASPTWPRRRPPEQRNDWR